METALIITIAGVIINTIVAFLVVSNRLGAYKNKVDTLETKTEKLETGLQEVRDMAVRNEAIAKERGPLIKNESPVSLTDRGERILIDSGGKKFVDDNFEELKNNVEESNPQTSYDVQELSKQVIESLKTDERINSMKEYLFKEGLELDDLTVVLGMYLRDKILTDKGWKAEDIDKQN